MAVAAVISFYRCDGKALLPVKLTEIQENDMKRYILGATITAVSYSHLQLPTITTVDIESDAVRR